MMTAHRVTVVLVVGLACAATSESAMAYYSPRLGRFISRDPIEEQGGRNLAAFVGNRPTDLRDPLGREAAPADGSVNPQSQPATKPTTWIRRRAFGPTRLKNGLADYEITITHIPPFIPAGATQVWQVVSCVAVGIADGLPFVEAYNVIDIADIGNQASFDDTLSWGKGGKVCVAREYCQHTIGFDDGERYAQMSGPVNISDALEILRKMRGPVGRFSTEYRYANKENCCSMIRNRVSTGESLAVGGVGRW